MLATLILQFFSILQEDMEAVVAAETVGTMMIVDHITEMAIVTAMNKTEVAEAVRAVGQLKVLFPIISPFFSTIFPHFPPFAIFCPLFPLFFNFLT